MAIEDAITFRPLAAQDLPLMVGWLNTPHVREWWADDPRTLEEACAEYGPQLAGEDPTAGFIILLDAQPIGYIQTYRVADYPEHAAAMDVEEGAAGVDLFIGEEAHVHRGRGAPILRAFLHTVVFAQPGVTSCIIDPVVTNTIAIRAYEKAGFRHLKTVTVPGEEQPEYLMRITPDAVSDVTRGSTQTR